MELGLSRIRTTALLLASGALLLVALRWALPPEPPHAATFGAALTTAAGWLLVLACGWLVAVAAALCTEAATGRRHRHWPTAPAPLRRLVALTSGVAVSIGLAAPALAGSAPGLDGVQLPARPIGASTVGASTVSASTVGSESTHEVVPGDTLWQIARSLAPDATDAGVATTVASIHRLNRELIGPDPDLLLPGQVLLLTTESAR